MKKHCKSITVNRIPVPAQVDSTVPGTTGLGVKLQMLELTIDNVFVMGRAKFMNGAI